VSIYHSAGNSEASEKQGVAALFQQSSPGIAATGVLNGLAVTQTTTASGSVQVGQGAGVVQGSLTAGASLLSNPAPTLDVFTANPVGALPRNDIVTFDSVTAAVKVFVGTPNATPTDPTVPNTAIPLARLRHAANATTIPVAKIDDLRVFTGLAGTASPAWVSYTPTISGAGWAAGGSTVTGRYIQVGKRVDFHIQIGFSGTATFGGAQLQVGLPVAHVSGRNTPVGSADCLDISASARYALHGIILGSDPTSVYLFSIGTAGQLFAVVSTLPFTWASSDTIYVSGTYEAA